MSFLKRNQIVAYSLFTSRNNNITGEYRERYRVLIKVSKVLYLYFHFCFLYLLLGGKQLLTRQVNVRNKEKYFIHHNIKVENCDSGGKQTTFPSICSLKGRAFSIFRQKRQGPNPSELDIKMFIPAATFCLQFEKCLL